MTGLFRDAPVVVYRAALVLPMTAPPIRDGAIAVRGQRIVHVGDAAWVRRELAERGIAAEERSWPGILMPGLVNAHTHLQYSGMAEVGRARYTGFDDWDAAFTEHYRSTPHDWAADAAAGAREAIAAGTTALADVVTDPAAMAALHDARLHGISYWEVMSWTGADWRSRGRAEVEAALDAVPTPPGAGLSPHAPYSLDTVPLLEIPDIVRERGARLHIHLGEAALESEGPEPDAAWHERRPTSFRELRGSGAGTSATEFVDTLGVLGPDCHIAHGVYMTARDRALLRARGTSVALCPRSNAVIGLDEPPVAAYLVEGSPIAVGTDSLSSSPSLDPLADVAELHRIARSQGYSHRDLAERLLGAVTIGGAHAMGLDTGADRTGYLAVGARADLAFFDVPVGGLVDDALEHLALAGCGTAAATVIAGELRHTIPAFAEQIGASP